MLVVVRSHSRTTTTAVPPDPPATAKDLDEQCLSVRRTETPRSVFGIVGCGGARRDGQRIACLPGRRHRAGDVMHGPARWLERRDSPAPAVSLDVRSRTEIPGANRTRRSPT